ncbi:MAG: hypothetical protein AAB434_05325 [Planctomycetota bacterium]
MRHVALFSLACAGIALGGDAPLDRVPLRSGEQVVEVVGETLLEIECRVERATIIFKREDLTGEIDYDGGAELERAREASKRKPATSIAPFQALAEKAAQGRARKVFEQHALWGLANSLRNAGHLTEAASKYAELVRKYPKTQYLYGAAENGVECFLSSEESEGTNAFLGLLRAVNVTDGGRFGTTRDYLAAAVEEKSNPAGAKAKFETVERASAGYPDLQRKAKVGGARCLLAAKDYAGAERKFREVAAGGSEGLLVIRAWNGVGDVNLAKSDLERNPANKAPLVKAALLAYLRSALQDRAIDGESREEMAKSTAKAGECFDMYADSFADAERRAEYKARARELYSECVSQFGPGGVWAPWSKKRLDR